MAKIVFDEDTIKKQYDLMLEYSKIITDNIEKESDLIEELHNKWSGPDYDAFCKQWESFTEVKDKKMKDQVIEYTRYLLALYNRVLEVSNTLYDKASQLPQ